MSSKEALQKGLIDQHIYLLIENRIAQLHGRLPDSISINEALSWGLLLVPLGRVRNPANNQRMTIEEACDTEFLDMNRSIVIAPGTDRIMTLARAVDTGVFDLHSGDMHNFVSHKTLTFTEAVFRDTSHSWVSADLVVFHGRKLWIEDYWIWITTCSLTLPQDFKWILTLL